MLKSFIPLVSTYKLLHYPFLYQGWYKYNEYVLFTVFQIAKKLMTTVSDFYYLEAL